MAKDRAKETTAKSRTKEMQSPLKLKPPSYQTRERSVKFAWRPEKNKRAEPPARLPPPRAWASGGPRVRRALPSPSPLHSPAVSNWRCGKGSRRGAGNPEALVGRGLGDSFEWNRADSSPVFGARSLLSVRRCSRRRVAARPGKVQTATSLLTASAEPRGGPRKVREPAALGRRKPRAFLSHVAWPGCPWSPDEEHRPPWFSLPISPGLWQSLVWMSSPCKHFCVPLAWEPFPHQVAEPCLWPVCVRLQPSRVEKLVYSLRKQRREGGLS